MGSQRCLALCVLACALFGGAVAQEKVLVLLESQLMRHSHSMFFSALEKGGLDLEYRRIDDSKLQLQSWGEWLYDHMIIFASDIEDMGGALDVPYVVEFVNSGRNLLLAVDSDASDTMRDLAADLGVDIMDKGTFVYDHISRPNDPQENHTLVATTSWVDAPAIIGDSPLPGPVLYQGIGMTVSQDSILSTRVLAASRTAYVGTPSGQAPLEQPSVLPGSKITLVAATQARNNARAVIAGSLAMFSNRLAALPVQPEAGGSDASGNAIFCKSVALWAFQQRGVLRIKQVQHHAAANSTQPREWYRVNEEAEFVLDLELWDGTSWLPYRGAQVQVEAVMLDPYVRQTLQETAPGQYRAVIALPDVYGVFKWVVRYRALGLSQLDYTEQFSIRPLQHDQYPRFVTAALPYYSSALSTMAAVFLLGLLFLYHK